MINLWLQTHFLLGALSSILWGSPATCRAIRNGVSASPGSQELPQPQWCADKHNSDLDGKQNKTETTAHVFSVCSRLWCERSLSSWCRATSSVKRAYRRPGTWQLAAVGSYVLAAAHDSQRGTRASWTPLVQSQSLQMLPESSAPPGDL